MKIPFSIGEIRKQHIKSHVWCLTSSSFPHFYMAKKMAIPESPTLKRQGTVKRRCPAPRCRSAPWRDPRRRCAARPPPRRSDLPRGRDHRTMGWWDEKAWEKSQETQIQVYIYSIYKKYIILWWIDWRILFSGEEVLAARDSTWLDLSKVGLVGTTGPTCRGSGCRVRLESPHGQFQPGRSFKGVGIDHRGNHQAHGINKNLQWCNLFPQL